MALSPFYRFRFFDDPFDPFFFHRVGFFEPWFDFDPFPPSFSFPSLQPMRTNERERITYSSTSTTNNNKAIQNPTESFRTQFNVDGFSPEKIKITVEGRTVIIEAKQEDRVSDNDYNLRELRKTFELPANVDASRLASYITPNKTLSIEAPINNTGNDRQNEISKTNNQSLVPFATNRDAFLDRPEFSGALDFRPRIIDQNDRKKQLEMTVDVKNFKPQELQVTVRDNELMVQGERRVNENNRSEQTSFYKSTTLPTGIQIDQIESRLGDDGQLKIYAPFIAQ